MTPDSTLAVTNTCPKDGVHLCSGFAGREGVAARSRQILEVLPCLGVAEGSFHSLKVQYLLPYANISGNTA